MVARPEPRLLLGAAAHADRFTASPPITEGGVEIVKIRRAARATLVRQHLWPFMAHSGRWLRLLRHCELGTQAHPAGVGFHRRRNACRAARDAWEWFFNPTPDDFTFTFRRICELLALNPQLVGRALRSARERPVR